MRRLLQTSESSELFSDEPVTLFLYAPFIYSSFEGD